MFVQWVTNWICVIRICTVRDSQRRISVTHDTHPKWMCVMSYELDMCNTDMYGSWLIHENFRDSWRCVMSNEPITRTYPWLITMPHYHDTTYYHDSWQCVTWLQIMTHGTWLMGHDLLPWLMWHEGHDSLPWLITISGMNHYLDSLPWHDSCDMTHVTNSWRDSLPWLITMRAMTLYHDSSAWLITISDMTPYHDSSDMTHYPDSRDIWDMTRYHDSLPWLITMTHNNERHDSISGLMWHVSWREVGAGVEYHFQEFNEPYAPSWMVLNNGA